MGQSKHPDCDFEAIGLPVGDVPVEGGRKKHAVCTAHVAYIPTGDVAHEGALAEHFAKIGDAGDIDVVQIARGPVDANGTGHALFQVLSTGSNNWRRYGHSSLYHGAFPLIFIFVVAQ